MEGSASQMHHTLKQRRMERRSSKAKTVERGGNVEVRGGRSEQIAGARRRKGVKYSGDL